MVTRIRPVLLRLAATFRVHEGAQHDYNTYIFVIGCLPKIIVFFHGCLAKYGKYLPIHQRAYLIGIDIEIGYILQLNPTMLIYRITQNLTCLNITISIHLLILHIEHTIVNIS